MIEFRSAQLVNIGPKERIECLYSRCYSIIYAHSALAVVSWGVRYISVGAHPGIILFQQNRIW